MRRWGAGALGRWSLLGLLWVSSCTPPPAAPVPAREINARTASLSPVSPDTRDVYRAALAYWATCFSDASITSEPDSVTGLCPGAKSVTLTVWGVVGFNQPLDTTSFDPFKPRHAQELYRSFLRANTGQSALPELGDLGQVKIESTLDEGPPGKALIKLSLPGWSAARDSALVDLSDTCGNFCGGGQGLVLHRSPSGWRVVGGLWVVNF